MNRLARPSGEDPAIVAGRERRRGPRPVHWRRGGSGVRAELDLDEDVVLVVNRKEPPIQSALPR